MAQKNVKWFVTPPLPFRWTKQWDYVATLFYVLSNSENNNNEPEVTLFC